MKVAHITSTYPPYKGGIGNTCFHLVQELRLQGHQVTVFTPKYSNEVRPSIDKDLVLLTPWLKYGNAAFIPQLAWKLRGYDLLHIHYPCLGAEFLWVWKLFHRQKKIVLHYQMDLIGSGILKKVFRLYQKVLLPIAVRLSDLILVSSLDYLESSFLFPYVQDRTTKCIGIPNGVDSNLFRPKPSNTLLIEKYAVNVQDTLLFVGGLDRAHYFKGLSVLFQALVQVPKAKVVIVGDGDLKTHYQTLAERLGIHHRIVFTGKVTDAELVEHYNLAAVTVLPSTDRTEAFGLVLLEAQACEKPVVASNLAGVRTVVQDGVDGLLTTPGDASDLAIKLNTLLGNPELRIRFGQNGRRKVLQMYTWPVICQQLVRLYESALNK